MNIDTSTLSSGSELKNNTMTSQTLKMSGNSAFKSQLSSLSSTAKEKSSSSSETSIENEKAVTTESKDDTSSDDKKVDSKNTEKAQNAEKNNDNNQVKDDEQQQNQGSNNQQNNGQQQSQNQASAELSDEINSIIKLNSKSNGIDFLQNQRISGMISDDIKVSSASIDYSKISMSDGDALFFANLVTKTDMSMQTIASEFQKSLNVDGVKNVQKTATVSAALMEALSDSMKTNKAFRIDFDKDVSVVMRVDRDGNLNANFIPGDKAVEAYLKNNIPYLKQRFDEQNLPYNELTYSRHRRQDQENEKRNNKENNNE